MKRKISLSLLACLSFAFAFAQRQVTGRVVSDNSQPISGVNVNVRGTNTTVATNNDGRFSITIPERNDVVLVFSSVGYTAQNINVGNRTEINVILVTAANAMNDVVVIGYQTVRRKDLLASVSSVSARDLKDIPINSAAEALNGRLAGVTATTSEGSPDANIRIRVRGGMSITQDNSPLFIVDGVQVENALSTLSPQDIQSIDVLKDAAATAIYGARGANGVIVITTKSGRPGRTIVSYNGFVGVKSLANKLDLLDPYDFVFYQSERSRGSSADSTSFTRNFGTTWDTLNVYKNINTIDWQEEVFGRTGITTTHNISAAGGNKKVTFNFGYTFNDDKAIVINSNYKRHLLNLKGDYNIIKGLKLGISARLINQDVKGAGVSSEQGSSYNRLRNAVKYRPFLSPNQDIDDQDPLADPNVGNGLNLYNPITLADAEYRNKTTGAYNTSANISYTFLKNLTFRSTVGYDYNEFADRQFFDSITPNAIINGARQPIVQLDTSIRRTFTNSNVLTYSIKGWKDKHDFDFLIGEETYELRTENHASLFRNFPLNTGATDAIKNTSLGTAATGYPRLNKTKYTNLSFFGRITYDYMDKYYLSFNMRADGASKFLPGANQWGYFPAGSIAWRVKNESFMKDVDFINDLKFRAGFGTVGNNRMADYLFITTFFNDGRYYYGINNQAVIAFYSNSLANPNLKWESTVNRNLGIDISLFRRFDLSVDFYDNRSKDLLLQVPIAATYGYSTQLQNVGKTTNKGFEIQLNAAIIRNTGGFNWNANFNISRNRNNVLALGPNQTQFFAPTTWGVSGQPSDYLVKVGQPVGSIWGLVTDGFYKVSDFNYDPATMIYTLKTGVVNNSGIIGPVQPGSIKFRDLNNDGVIDLNNDRRIIGDANPKFTGGLNQQFTYKNWDASVFVNFSYGNDIYNANKIEFTNGYSTNSNMLAIMKDRWKVVTPDGKTAQWVSGNNVYGIAPSELEALNANATIWAPLRSSGAFYPHSWAIEDGSFLRLNNLTIGYSFPLKSISGIKMTKLRLYATANNLAIITNYTGYDPEVGVRNNGLTPGLDYSAYPKSRTFIFGVNASF